MNESPHEHGLRWLEQARHDQGAATDLLTAGRFNVACFLAQQSAKKTVKGYLIAQGAEEPWGHSVTRLLEDAATYNDEFNALMDTAKGLDKLYIPTRYPDSLPAGIPATAYTKAEAEQAIRWADSMITAMSFDRK